jgi:L-ribulose-5-phosphate 3-epimerase
MNDLKFPIAAITDEFSPSDFSLAINAMASIGMTGAELRVVNGKNIMDLSNDEIRAAKDTCDAKGIQILGIASPILKCTLPNGPAVDTRFQQDIFNSKHTFDDQPRLLDRAFQISELTGAKIIRVFSYWRTVEPSACFDAVVEALTKLANQAAPHGITIGIENEHACHIGTAEESKAILAAVQHPNLKLVWDPANALVAGENPFPHGYGLLPVDRIAHVHVKDCHMEGHTPIWGPVGTRHVDWRGQIAALRADGYKGFLSLETHWPGPAGDKFLASTICGWNLRGLSAM